MGSEFDGSEFLKQMANEGKPAAMFMLAEVLLIGAKLHGVSKDEAPALKWLERASDLAQ
jgi:TPR repeat protein